MIQRRTLLALSAAGLALPALAQPKGFPNKPVRLVVPYAPGGGTDAMARALAQKLSALWSQPVVVENKPGASESIAASNVARAPADGYSLMFASDSTFQLNPLLYTRLPYDPDKDLVPITRFALGPFALIVNSDMPVSNFKEFLAYARKRDRKLAYGSFGVANSTNLGLSWISKQFGLDMVHAPFAGQGPANLALLSGEIDVMLGNIVPSSIGFIKQGKIKVLATSGATRLPNAPEIPTFTELGYKNIDTAYSLGLAAPAGTPAEVMDKIAADVKRAVSDPELIAYASETLSLQLFAENAQQYRDFIASSRRSLEERIKAAGIGKLDQ